LFIKTDKVTLANDLFSCFVRNLSRETTVVVSTTITIVTVDYNNVVISVRIDSTVNALAAYVCIPNDNALGVNVGSKIRPPLSTAESNELGRTI